MDFVKLRKYCVKLVIKAQYGKNNAIPTNMNFIIEESEKIFQYIINGESLEKKRQNDTIIQ